MVLTCSKWISDIVGQTLAHGVVVDGEALGKLSTGSRAGVLALLIDTGHVSRTLLVHGTLGSTTKKENG